MKIKKPDNAIIREYNETGIMLINFVIAFLIAMASFNLGISYQKHHTGDIHFKHSHAHIDIDGDGIVDLKCTGVKK